MMVARSQALSEVGQGHSGCQQQFIVFDNQMRLYILDITAIESNGVETDTFQWVC